MMKCLICGRISLPGAKLCPDCSSARKRAFAATVTQPLLDAAGSGRYGGRLLRPSQSVAATARRSAERALHAKPPADVAPAVPSRRMEYIFLTAGVVAILLIGAYVARQVQKSRQAVTPQLSGQTVPAGSDAMANSVSVVPAGLAPKNVAETQSPSASTIPAADVPAPAVRPEPAKRARQRNVPVEAVAPAVEPTPPPTIAAAPMPAPVPEVREAPRPDALQMMKDSLARCADGGLLDRILCDQRVRREYCDGKWGQVPQCPSGVANDHGQ